MRQRASRKSCIDAASGRDWAALRAPAIGYRGILNIHRERSKIEIENGKPELSVYITKDGSKYLEVIVDPQRLPQPRHFAVSSAPHVGS